MAERDRRDVRFKIKEDGDAFYIKTGVIDTRITTEKFDGIINASSTLKKQRMLYGLQTLLSMTDSVLCGAAGVLFLADGLVFQRNSQSTETGLGVLYTAVCGLSTKLTDSRQSKLKITHKKLNAISQYAKTTVIAPTVGKDPSI